MLIFTNYFIEAIALGLFSALTGYMVNTLLSYGHILWKLRYRAALKAAKRTGDKEVIRSIENIGGYSYVEGWDLETAEEAANEAYWNLVKEVPGFRVWVCAICFSLRFTLIISFLYSALGYFLSSSLIEHTVGSLILIVGSLAVSHFIIAKI